MINRNHSRLSIVRQCRLVSISRWSFYRELAAGSKEMLPGSPKSRVYSTQDPENLSASRSPQEVFDPRLLLYFYALAT
jgi:hypothetical protein